MGSAREEILNKLKKAVHPEPQKPDFEAPVYFPIDEPLELVFKENLEKVNGSVYLHQSETDMLQELKSLLKHFEKDNICCRDADIQAVLTKNSILFSSCLDLPESIEVGITTCEFLVAHTGSVMVSSALAGARQLFVYPPVHIVIARYSQLVDYLQSAYSSIQDKYKENLPSQITLITGPSRTADIEKTLVMGAHGPKELHVLVF